MALATLQTTPFPWKEELSQFWHSFHEIAGRKVTTPSMKNGEVTNCSNMAPGFQTNDQQMMSTEGGRSATAPSRTITPPSHAPQASSSAKASQNLKPEESHKQPEEVIVLPLKTCSRSRSRSRSKSRNATQDDTIQTDCDDAVRQTQETAIQIPQVPEIEKSLVIDVAKPRQVGHSFTWQRRKTPTSKWSHAWVDAESSEGEDEEKRALEDKVVDDLKKKSEVLLSRGGWDQRPEHVDKEIKENEYITATHLMLHQPSDEFTLRKRRTAFVGNLPKLQLTAESLIGILVTMFQQLPDFQEKYAGAGAAKIITDVFIPPKAEGTYAFVTFDDEVLCTTAINMTGFHYGNQVIAVRRVNGYKPPVFGDMPPLNTEPLRLLGFLPQKEQSLQLSQLMPQMESAESTGCELYFGNLNSKQMNENVLKALLLPVCERLPEYNFGKGPAMKKISVCNGGSSCFIEFQSEQMAMRIIPMFDGTSFFGRNMRVRLRADFGQGMPQVKDLADPLSLMSESSLQSNSTN